METNQPQQAKPSQAPQQTNSKGPNVALIIIIVILILLLLGGGVGYYIYYRAKKAVQQISDTASSNTPSSSSEEGKLPAADVAGTDLAEVPRFTNSIRSYYNQNQDINFTQLKYKAKATSAEIMDFYKKQMPSLGWTLTGSDDTSLTYSKNNIEATITINDTVNSITTYQLDYMVSSSD